MTDIEALLCIWKDWFLKHSQIKSHLVASLILEGEKKLQKHELSENIMFISVGN